MGECGAEIELGERGVGGLETCPQDAALVTATHVEGPAAVGLVLENVAPHQRERLFERAAGLPGRFAGRALEQLVEAIEVQRDELGREPVRLGLGDDKCPGPIPVGGEVAAKTGDERLQRAGGVPGALVSPDELGEAVGRHAMPPRCQQDLEHLLRPDPAEVTRPEAAPALLDRERPEQPDPRQLRLSRRRGASLSSPQPAQFVTDLSEGSRLTSR